MFLQSIMRYKLEFVWGGQLLMDLNKLLAFNQLVIDKTEDEKMDLARLLNIDYGEYKKRIVGKEKEAD